jgi:hypothetical protein
MKDVDHWNTGSHGRKGKAGKVFRKNQGELVKKGDHDAAFQKGIDDVRERHGNAYDQHIEEAIKEMPKKFDGYIDWDSLPKKKDK